MAAIRATRRFAATIVRAAELDAGLARWALAARRLRAALTQSPEQVDEAFAEGATITNAASATSDAPDPDGAPATSTITEPASMRDTRSASTSTGARRPYA